MAKFEKSTQDGQFLSGLKHIRHRPGMYIGTTANALKLLEEVRDNALDEALSGFCTEAWFTLRSDGSVSIRDNGRGLPTHTKKTPDGTVMPMARAMLIVPNSSTHYGDDLSVSSGTNGIGLKACTGLSSYVLSRVWRDGKYVEDRFIYDEVTGEPGVPQVALKPDGSYKMFRQTPENVPEGAMIPYTGTEITFLPAAEVFDSIEFDFDALVRDLHRIAYLVPQITFHVHDERTGQSATLHEEGGLKAYVEHLVESSDGEAVTAVHEFEGSFQDERMIIQAKIAMAWTTAADVSVHGFTNTLYNRSGGEHVSGFYIGVSRLINNYAKTLGLAKDTIEARDVRAGLVAAVSILHTAPVYSSQTKEQMTETTAKPALNQIVYAQGQLEWDKYIAEVEAVVAQALRRAADRKKLSDLSSIKLDTKEMKGKVSKKLEPAKKTRGMPGVKQAEIFITEGDSASGSLNRTRINGDGGLYQAVFPVRGKVINARKTTPDRVFANEEASTIFAALGCGVGHDNYREDRLNYDRIIIATDSDSDGDNIASLLITLFYVFAPQLLVNGHVYRAQAPLYRNYLPNGDVVNTYAEQEQTDFLSTDKGKNIKEVSRYKGLGELGDPLTLETLVTPGTRRLYQFTVEDFETAEETNIMLMGPEVSRRREFLMESAELAQVDS